jgi:BlaI family penicillinase repressor
MIPISDAESRVMAVLWERAPMSADEIVQALSRSEWHEKTVKTLLNRLLGKGALAVERDGRRYLYRPMVTREAWLSHESRGLLDRLFGGRLAPLLTHFSRHEKLSARDIAEIRRLLDEIERKEHDK